MFLTSLKNFVSGKKVVNDGIWNLRALDRNLNGDGEDSLAVYATTCLTPCQHCSSQGLGHLLWMHDIFIILPKVDLVYLSTPYKR